MWASKKRCRDENKVSDFGGEQAVVESRCGGGGCGGGAGHGGGRAMVEGGPWWRVGLGGVQAVTGS